MRRFFLGLVAMSPLALMVAGCELVFGLDEYAQATSEASTGSTGTEVGPGSGAGSSSSKGEGSTGTKGDGGGGGAGGDDPSGSSSGGPSCPCVPDGWTLFEAHATTQEAELVVCDGDINADRALADVEVSCGCECGIAAGLSCQLSCWSDVGCTGAQTILGNALCTGMPPASSCALSFTQGGSPTDARCALTESVLSTMPVNVFDLCTADAAGARCDEEGVCAPPPSGSVWCIEGPVDASCPADWPDDHTLSEGGAPACDCDCVDDVDCNVEWRVSNGNLCLDSIVTIADTTCVDLAGQRNRHSGGPPIGEDAIEGGCTPAQNVGPGRLEGADETRLCCRPPS